MTQPAVFSEWLSYIEEKFASVKLSPGGAEAFILYDLEDASNLQLFHAPAENSAQQLLPQCGAEGEDWAVLWYLSELVEEPARGCEKCDWSRVLFELGYGVEELEKSLERRREQLKTYENLEEKSLSEIKRIARTIDITDYQDLAVEEFQKSAHRELSGRLREEFLAEVVEALKEPILKHAERLSSAGLVDAGNELRDSAERIAARSLNGPLVLFDSQNAGTRAFNNHTDGLSSRTLLNGPPVNDTMNMVHLYLAGGRHTVSLFTAPAVVAALLSSHRVP